MFVIKQIIAERWGAVALNLLTNISYHLYHSQIYLTTLKIIVEINLGSFYKLVPITYKKRKKILCI